MGESYTRKNTIRTFYWLDLESDCDSWGSSADLPLLANIVGSKEHLPECFHLQENYCF